MGNVGERLQQARVRAGLSLREISARTKIRAALLDAIEREDFGQLPRGLLARGFLRAYAREVGLDPESVVRQFQHEFESEAMRPDAGPPTTTADSEQKHDNDRQPAWRLQFLAAAVVAVLSGAVFISLNRYSEIDDRVAPDPIATVGAGAEPAADTGQDAELAEDQPSGEVTAAVVNTSEADSLTVDLHPAGPVWVEATADGTPVLYQLIHPGERHVIDVREELLIRVGDAGAFQYSINGVRGRQVGLPGAVRSIRITRENYTTFQDH